MTTIDQNIAIAEKIGWTPHPENAMRVLKDRSWRKDGEVRTYDYTCGDDFGIGISDYKPLPRYSESLDLMHEAEKIMNAKMWKKYIITLARVIANQHDSSVRVSVPTNVLIAASAQQRSEAFLRILGLWR